MQASSSVDHGKGLSDEVENSFQGRGTSPNINAEDDEDLCICHSDNLLTTDFLGQLHCGGHKSNLPESPIRSIKTTEDVDSPCPDLYSVLLLLCLCALCGYQPYKFHSI